MKLQVHVDTPKGKKLHGEVDTETKVFERHLKYKDMMFKYKAWSIEPGVLQKLQEKGYKELHYYVTSKTGTKLIRISVEDALAKGFKETYGGGPTWYIREEHWHEEISKAQ
jgi:hypothetical protein